MVCLDLALVISLLMVQTYAAAVRSADVASGIWPLPSSVQLGMRGPEPLDFGCHVAVEGGNATFTLGTLLPVLLCALAPLVVTELFSLVSFFPDMRRVRRQLKPLNDLALKADALVSADTLGAATRGSTASGEDKMASLEQAIERASVDAPRVRTGDKDLESIEVALNRLLRQMQDAKLQQMRFVNDASHELRTPIAVVRGYVDMLDRWGKDDQAVLEESIAALKLEGEHMQELVEQLLFLARGDSGRNELHRRPCNVATLVAEIAEESQMIDAGHRYELSSKAKAAAEAQDPRFLLMADAVLVKQDRDFMSTTYEVTLSDGTEIDFTSNGQWKDVDVKQNTMPLGFIPAQITKTLNARHAGDAIKQIERKRQGYKVELSSGLEAHFNAKLQLVRYDD